MPRRLAALCVLCLAASAHCADAPADSQETLAAAKKDLADIKAIASPPDTAGSLPAVDMKGLNPGPGADRMAIKPQMTEEERAALLEPSGKKARTGTGNWLVDAMERKDAKPAEGKDAPSRAETDALGFDAAKATERLDAEALASGDSREEARKPQAEAAYNPLDAFMGGWVSTRDKDLLLPGGHTPAGPDSGKAGGDLPLPGQDLASDLLAPQEPLSFSEPKGGANPYLEALNLGGPSSVRFFSAPELPDFSLPSARPTASGALQDERPSEVQRSFIPDFAQPSDDDKYFKQMKRF